MREMVLNHASLSAPDKYTALGWLKDLAVGMIELSQYRVVQSVLRKSRDLYSIQCYPYESLWDAYLDLDRQGWGQESLFLMQLADKSPLLRDVDQEIKDRFRLCEAVGCDAKMLSPEDGKPLVLCAITDGIAVGFPSEPIWKRDQLDVSFNELIEDSTGEISELEVSETIDNLTQTAHAKPILERHRANLRKCSSYKELWSNRAAIFPNLLFSPGVERQLERLDHALLRTIINKLTNLDKAAEEWPVKGGPSPQWRSHVTDETDSVKNNPRLCDARRFRSCKGSNELFMWHARYGNSGRIHLRFDASTYEVEIGYIGPHLPH